MPTPKPTHAAALEITPVIDGRLATLHDDPQKIHHLLDMLDMPPGTEVRVTTVAASVIVR